MQTSIGAVPGKLNCSSVKGLKLFHQHCLSAKTHNVLLKNYLLDITIVHPTAPSNLNHSQKLLGQAEVSEKLKINKYDEISQEQHCIFIPFVIETYGGLGKKAQDFLNELSIFAIDHALIKSRFDIVNGLRYAIACSVQRGNALIASAGYANALRVFRDRA